MCIFIKEISNIAPPFILQQIRAFRTHILSNASILINLKSINIFNPDISGLKREG